MPKCLHCLRESTAEHYDRVIYNQTALYGPWRGWRLAGRWLVSPDGDRLLPERLRGIVFTERHRRQSQRSRETPPIARLPERERFEGAA